MSEHKQEKWLYSFVIPKEIEVEKQVEEVLNNETVKVTRKVKEKKDVKFALKRPNRRMYEQADLFYGIKLSEGIRAGLLTKALLLKRYRNDGGALSEGDTAHFNTLLQQLAALENDHQRYLLNLDKMAAEENKKRVEEVFDKKVDVLRQLQAFETINRALFSHTAESKADVQLANWWTVHLSFWDETGEGNFIPYFSGETFEDKMKFWDTAYEMEDPFTTEILARFSLLVSYWNAGATTLEDFEKAEKESTPTLEVEKVETSETKLVPTIS